jgi:hypothetical protein
MAQILESGTIVDLPPLSDEMQIARTENRDPSSNPYRLFIHLASGHVVEIDLDERGWMAMYGDYLRVRSTWELRSRDGSLPPVMMPVEDGEQPFYATRHVGMTGAGGSNEIVAYGIGRKIKVKGRWEIRSTFVLPGAIVCSGEDVYRLGEMIVRALGPR